MESAHTEKKRSWILKVKHMQKELEENSNQVNEFDLPGVKKITLSLTTQKAVGCVIGAQVTADNPWIYILKQNLEENIAEKPEFLSLKQDVIDYSEQKVLLGYDHLTTEPRNQFFVCVTSEAKDAVLNILERHNQELQAKLKTTVIRKPRKWKSFGSEVEIEENMIRNLRPLIEVHFESKYPLFETKTKFSMRLVADATDGYVQLLPDRHAVNNVLKKRVSTAIQAAGATASHEAQTNPTYPTNKWTQYCFEYDEATLDKPVTNEMIDFMNTQVDRVCDNIRVNESINFHVDDYKQLSTDVPKPISIDISQEFIFHDVIWCKGKKVTSIAWHPVLSGVLVAAYSESPLHSFTYEENKKDIVNETVYSKKLALLWSYTDTMQPKLYLECHRNVNVINFCEYNPDIIVGGCENGQVIIWDITGRLEQLEARNVLSIAEQEHRLIMNSTMNWTQDISEEAKVHPVAVSAGSYSHSEPITGMMWLPPRCSITCTGKMKYDPETTSLQFLTCALDGLVNVWDLKSKPPLNKRPRTIPTSRLKLRPTALISNTSYLKDLDRTLKPLFKLIIQDKHPIPISCICVQKTIYEYKAQNAETQNDPSKRAYFTQTNLDDKNHVNSTLLLGTTTGQFLRASWEGYEYDEDKIIDSEVCKIEEYTSIHDGPIRSCTRNPLEPNLILTIGGKIFMIWDELHRKAILWQKSKVDYVSGLWFSTVVNIFIVSRVDGYLELWDLNISTSRPANIIFLTHNTILDFITDNHLSHTRKHTIAMTDNAGAIHILKEPDLLNISDETEKKQASQMLLDTKERKIRLHNWINTWHQSTKISIEKPAQYKSEYLKDYDYEEKQLVKKRKEVELDTFEKILAEKWKNKQEKFMHQTLLEKKKLNLKEISVRSEPLRIARDKGRELQKKENQTVASKDKIFANTKTLLFKETIIKERKEIVADVTHGKDLAKIKKYCISNYKSAVLNALDKIEETPFHYSLNWRQLISEGRERRKMLGLYVGKANLHANRYEQQCKMKRETIMKVGSFVETVSKLSKYSGSSKSGKESIPNVQE